MFYPQVLWYTFHKLHWDQKYSGYQNFARKINWPELHDCLRLTKEQRAKRNFSLFSTAVCMSYLISSCSKEKKRPFRLHDFFLTGQLIPPNSHCSCLEHAGYQIKIGTHIYNLDFLALNASPCLEVLRLVQDLRGPYLPFPNFRSSLRTVQAAKNWERSRLSLAMPYVCWTSKWLEPTALSHGQNCAKQTLKKTEKHFFYFFFLPASYGNEYILHSY